MENKIHTVQIRFSTEKTNIQTKITLRDIQDKREQKRTPSEPILRNKNNRNTYDTDNRVMLYQNHVNKGGSC
jgi:hypothetical protein